MVHTLLQSDSGSYLASVRQWFIPCFSQTVVHTLVQSDSGSYFGSVRQWFIPCFSKTVVHTLLQSDSGSYFGSVRQWFILWFSQTVVHTLFQSHVGSVTGWFSHRMVQSPSFVGFFKWKGEKTTRSPVVGKMLPPPHFTCSGIKLRH